MKRLFFTFLLMGFAAFAGLLAGCDNTTSANQASSVVLEGKTMGTYWRVSLAGVGQQRAGELREKIQAQLDGDDQLMSGYKADSTIMQFNHFHSTAPWPANEALSDIVALSLRIGAKTQGAMDITVTPLVNLWGFGPDKQPAHTPTQAEIDSAKAHSGLQHLQVIYADGQQWLQKDIPQLTLDLSTVGEGYAADHLARLMEQLGISRYLVSVGGALVSRGLNPQGQPWRVAIQKPTDTENQIQAVVDINGHGISTSGSYRNYYELDGQRVSHIIDPATGRPITHHLVSVTVIAPTALEADGWDTGLMVLGLEKARQLALDEKLAVYMISKTPQGFAVWMSPQFKTFLLEK